MELKKVAVPGGFGPAGAPHQIRVALEDADWVMAAGREKLVRSSGSLLVRLLQRGESVRLVSKAFVSRSWSWLRNSWRRRERVTLVVTDRRLLLIHADAKGRPSLYVNQIPLESIRKARLRLFGFGVAVQPQQGVIRFRGLSSGVSRQLVDLLPNGSPRPGGLQPLCPACLRPQNSVDGPCVDCGAQCKSPRTAALRSLGFPGLGDLYLGQPMVGATAAIMMAFIWAAVAFMFGFSFLENGFQKDSGLAMLAVASLVFVFGHGSSASAAAASARRSRYSVDGHLPTGSSGNDHQAPIDIVPAGTDEPAAYERLRAAATGKEPVWDRVGRPILAVLLGVGGFLVIVVAFAFVDHWAAREVPLEEADYEYVPTIDELAEWREDYDPDPELVTASKTIYPDGSYSIDYLYEEPGELFLQTNLSVERSAGDAMAVYAGGRVGFRAVYGTLEDDIELQDASDFFVWGEPSMHAFLLSEGAPFGQVFLAQRGRVMFSMTLSGLYFDQAEDFEAFVGPSLERIEEAPLV